MRLYVIGPVTGRENLNRAEFERARKMLESRGYAVEIPHDSVPPDAEWGAAMAISTNRLRFADGVARLNGWHASRGARLESKLARALGIPCKFVGGWK